MKHSDIIVHLQLYRPEICIHSYASNYCFYYGNDDKLIQVIASQSHYFDLLHTFKLNHTYQANSRLLADIKDSPTRVSLESVGLLDISGFTILSVDDEYATYCYNDQLKRVAHNMFLNFDDITVI